MSTKSERLSGECEALALHCLHELDVRYSRYLLVCLTRKVIFDGKIPGMFNSKSNF